MKLKKFQFINDGKDNILKKGYSLDNPKTYIGQNFNPIVDKINEIIDQVNKLTPEVSDKRTSLIKAPFKFPTHAKVIKGKWAEDYDYGDVWCHVEEIDMIHKQMSLNHPIYDEFSWVCISDCVFK